MGRTRSSNTLPAHSDRRTGHKTAPLFRRHRKMERHGLHRLPPQLVGHRKGKPVVRVLLADHRDHRHKSRNVERHGGLSLHFVPALQSERGEGRRSLFRRMGHIERRREVQRTEQFVGQCRRIDLHGKIPDPLRRRDQDPSRHVLHDLLRPGDIPAFERDYRGTARLAVRLLLVAAPRREGNDCGKECHNLHPLFHSFHHLTEIRSDGKSRNAPLCRQIYSTSRPVFPAERHFLRTNPSPHHPHRHRIAPTEDRQGTDRAQRNGGAGSQGDRRMNPERDRRAEGSQPSQEGIGNEVHRQKRKDKRQFCYCRIAVFW